MRARGFVHQFCYLDETLKRTQASSPVLAKICACAFVTVSPLISELWLCSLVRVNFVPPWKENTRHITTKLVKYWAIETGQYNSKPIDGFVSQ